MGFGVEVNMTGPSAGSPALMARADLGSAAGDLSGIAVAPRGPVVLALRNGTLWALAPTTLSVLWRSQAAEPLAAGPTVVGNGAGLGGTVYAMGASGTLDAWNLTNGHFLWSRPLGSPDLGSAPAVYQGNVYVLTQQNLSIVNATTGSLELQTRNFTADPTHSLAVGDNELFAQGNLGLDSFSPFGAYEGATTDVVRNEGAPLWSNGYFAVAGPSGDLVAGVPGTVSVWSQPSGTANLLPAAASSGRLYATDGQGPLYGWNLSDGNPLPHWRSAFYATGAPTVVGDQVYVGANDTSGAPGVADLNATTGAANWFYPLSEPVNTSVVVADGTLYAVDESGDVTALGAPPIAVSLFVNRNGAEAGTPFLFSNATPTGGASGVSYSITWTFSDGSSVVAGTAPSVPHAFSTPGPAWAAAVVTDNEGTFAGPFVIPVTVFPPLTVSISLNQTGGNVPLWVQASAQFSGGNGTYTAVAFQVVNIDPGWYPASPSSPTRSLLFGLSGLATVVAWVNDSADDVAESSPEIVHVGPAQFPPPQVTLSTPSQGLLDVVWSTAPSPGFLAWQVGLSIDGGSLRSEGTLDAPNASSLQISGVPQGANLTVEVARDTVYGTFTGSASISTPLLAPVLGLAPAALPGEALLTWTVPVPIDRFLSWTIEETLPGASAPTALRLPAYSASSTGPYNLTTAPVPDLGTTTFQMQVETTHGAPVGGTPVAFTPLVSPVSIDASGVALGISVSWNDLAVSQALPDFASVRVCYASGSLVVSSSWTCPFTSDFVVGSTVIAVPSAGSYEVNVTAVATNGFAVPSSVLVVSVPGPAPATAWYALPLAGVPFWFWAVFLLLALLVLLVGAMLYRERRSALPSSEEVLPWNPEEPGLEPRARPKNPDTLRETTKLHRHGRSHTHRHPAPGSEEGSEEEEATVVRVKRSSAGAAPASAEGEEEEEDHETDQEGRTVRPSKASTKPSAPRSAKVEKVGEEASVEEEGERGELSKLPVVLRHPEVGEEEEASPEEAPAPSPRAPAPRKPKEGPKPSTPAKTAEDDEEEETTSAPPVKRPAPKPKSENEEPTL